MLTPPPPPSHSTLSVLHQGVRSRLCSLCSQPVIPCLRALAALQHLPHDVFRSADSVLLPGVAAGLIQHKVSSLTHPLVSSMGP
jgi:hypothetical protein